MINLTNGRGQLGNALAKIIENIEPPVWGNGLHSSKKQVHIYHTWNIDDKSEEVQAQCFQELMSFTNRHLKDRVVFISTMSQKESYYVKYKHLAEAHVLSHCEDSVVVRLPTIIGKGAVEKLKTKEIVPYGTMEIMSIEEACHQILRCVSYKGLLKIVSLDGEKIRAKTVQQILLA
jgi:hypothetical protein